MLKTSLPPDEWRLLTNALQELNVTDGGWGGGSLHHSPERLLHSDQKDTPIEGRSPHRAFTTTHHQGDIAPQLLLQHPYSCS